LQLLGILLSVSFIQHATASELLSLQRLSFHFEMCIKYMSISSVAVIILNLEKFLLWFLLFQVLIYSKFLLPQFLLFQTFINVVLFYSKFSLLCFLFLHVASASEKKAHPSKVSPLHFR
jgi:hypothetical protein